MTSEKENNGCKCRQFNFLGWPMVVTWDADHFREVSTNTEDYGKVCCFIFFVKYFLLLFSLFYLDLFLNSYF